MGTIIGFYKYLWKTSIFVEQIFSFFCIFETFSLFHTFNFAQIAMKILNSFVNHKHYFFAITCINKIKKKRNTNLLAINNVY